MFYIVFFLMCFVLSQRGLVEKRFDQFWKIFVWAASGFAEKTYLCLFCKSGSLPASVRPMAGA